MAILFRKLQKLRRFWGFAPPPTPVYYKLEYHQYAQRATKIEKFFEQKILVRVSPLAKKVAYLMMGNEWRYFPIQFSIVTFGDSCFALYNTIFNFCRLL